MKRYPEYKDSGVEWIGKIPQEWTVAPLKHLSTFVSRGAGPVYVEESGVRVVNQACIYWNGFREDRVKYHEECDWTKLKGALRSGDLLVNSTGTGTLGRALLFDRDGAYVADSHVTIVRFGDKVLPRYVYYLVQTPLYQGFIYAALVNGSTNQIELSREGLLSTDFIVPMIRDQRAIADFLDRKTQEIDTLIQKKQALIDLLKEQRTAVINRAVTKGLDPTVPMKDSGIEWLGEVPEHWRVGKLGWVAPLIQTGPFGSQLHADDYIEGGIPLVNPSNIVNGRIVADQKKTVSTDSVRKLSRHVLETGNIVFARRGEMGRCALVTENEAGWMCGTGSIKVKFDREQVFPSYMTLLLSTSGVEQWLVLESVGSTMNNLNTEILTNIPVPIPPRDEQEAIVRHVNHQSTNAGRLLRQEQQGIDLLKELRTSLISEVVTGKIDVRDEVPAPVRHWKG